MASFDDILNGLHTNGSTSKLTDSSGVVTINEKREFELPSDGYDTVLAYSGDINSQIITFQLPSKHENHDLHGCTFKKLKWKNLSSGLEGTSDLVEVEGKVGQVKWEIPPEAFTQAGVLEISISLYDKKDGKIAFSWNTPTSTVFSVGSGFEEVPLDLTLPAENEILLICENKQIVAPKGYNNHIANFGDAGTSKVYFQCKKSIAGIDITNKSTKVKILVNFNDTTTPSDSIEINEISQDSVLIIWNVPDWVTNNDSKYFGNIKISLVFSLNNIYWKSSPISSLYIGETLIDDLGSTATAPTFEEEVTKIVNDVIENSDEIGRANWTQENTNGKGYIENKPAIKSGIGANSVIENKGSYAGGISSSVCGTSTEAHGDGSRAEGLLSRAYGHHSHAEGMETTTYGYRSHTEGLGTITGSGTRPGLDDEGAHAEGIRTHAYGKGTHTEGIESVGEGNGSHAEGGYTCAQYAYSHAEGYGVYTTMQYQHAQGKFNVKDKNNNYAHIVGNGDDNNHRSNAHTLDWNGNAWYAGELRVGGTSYKNGSKLATEAYVYSMINGGKGYYSVQEEILGTSETEHSVGYNKDKPFLQYAYVADCGDCTEITVTRTVTRRTGPDTSETVLVFEETTKLDPNEPPIKINTTDAYTSNHFGGNSEGVWLSCKMSSNKNPLKIVFLAQ